MFESQGTTPEFQGNPESGVDQLLNRTAPVTIPTTLEEALIRGSELQLEILELKQKLALSTESVETWRSNYFESQDLIAKARRLIEESLSEAEEPMVLYAEFRDAFEVLDVQVTEEVEVEITATWTVTVTKPLGHELEGDDFTASLDNENSELSIQGSWHTPDMEVREL